MNAQIVAATLIVALPLAAGICTAFTHENKALSTRRKIRQVLWTAATLYAGVFLVSWAVQSEAASPETIEKMKSYMTPSAVMFIPTFITALALCRIDKSPTLDELVEAERTKSRS